jgi:hypothetical protein
MSARQLLWMVKMNGRLSLRVCMCKVKLVSLEMRIGKAVRMVCGWYGGRCCLQFAVGFVSRLASSCKGTNI